MYIFFISALLSCKSNCIAGVFISETTHGYAHTFADDILSVTISRALNSLLLGSNILIVVKWRVHDLALMSTTRAKWRQCKVRKKIRGLTVVSSWSVGLINTIVLGGSLSGLRLLGAYSGADIV